MINPIAYRPSPSDYFGLYIHWPFCKSRCPYCDYNAHVRERVDVQKFGQALLTEMRYWGERHNPRKLTSIFFGGGTPSLMPPELVAELISTAKSIWGFTDDIEITLEANPTSSEAENFATLAQAGVNRLSLGVQALDDDYLKFLGRTHSVDQALSAIQIAAKHFPRYSFDIMYARPNQSLEQWRAELDRAIPLLRDHISLYQLTVEPQTAFATIYARGDFKLPDDDHAAMLYDYTLNRLAQENFHAYEVSSFAKPGAECRHNLCYWDYHDYIGIGCGAHGRVTDSAGKKFATVNARMPEAWQEKVEQSGHSLIADEILDMDDWAGEMIMMNLRLQNGVDLNRFRQLTGKNVLEFLQADNYAEFLRHGFLQTDEKSLSVTSKGRNVLNEMLLKLL